MNVVLTSQEGSVSLSLWCQKLHKDSIASALFGLSGPTEQVKVTSCVLMSLVSSWKLNFEQDMQTFQEE